MADLPPSFDVAETLDTLRITFDSNLENIDRACSRAMAFLKMKSSGVNKHLFSINLAMREGLSNAVRHGNRLDEKKQVFCEVRLTAQQSIQIVIKDQGGGFDWKAAEKRSPDDDAEHGRGLGILKLYCSSHRFNEKGNRLILEKDISS